MYWVYEYNNEKKIVLLNLCTFIKQLICDNSILQFRFIGGYVAAPCANFDPWPFWGGGPS